MRQVLFLFFLTPTLSVSQKLEFNSISDSLLKIEKINFMNADSDSLMGRLDPNTTSAQIIYSPDNRFKILTTIGESCGAYCNPYNMSWIYFARKDNKTVEKPLDFIYPVTEIKLLTKTKNYTDYLILTQNWCRPRGIEAGNNWNFHQLRIHADSIQFIQPVFGNTENNSSEVYSADVLCKETETAGMWFNSKTKVITTINYIYSDRDEKCYLFKGKYNFIKGRFLQLPTTRTIVELSN